MRVLMALILAAAVSGCVSSDRLQLGDGAGWGTKSVAAKEPPATLVAVDGTRCTVTVSTYHRTKRGDRITCHWRGHEEGPVFGR